MPPPTLRPRCVRYRRRRPAAAATGSIKLVDGKSGDDAANGSEHHPWKTIQHGLAALAPGDTLYIRGGVYFESLALSAQGTASAPITIRSAPGELAIVDGGLREFYDTPSKAWEPVPDGAKGEYQSTTTYAITRDRDHESFLGGNFADSMIPLHDYTYDSDFRTDNEYWTVKNTEAGTGIYVGPGLWWDATGKRIHVRLAHTTLASQPNYTGDTDPRNLKLSIGTDRSALRIDNAKYVRIQDLVFRGSAADTVSVTGAEHLDLDGVTIYGGAPALRLKSTSHFRLIRSALRGRAAPWSSRASMKYLGGAPYLMIAGLKGAQNEDWEIAHDEFTDNHDGLILDTIKTLRFHHNRGDNFNDDGIYLALPPRDVVPEDVQIYENVISRVYTVFAFAQHRTTTNSIGPGVYIFRNVFDLRDGTYNWIAKDAATDASGTGLHLAGRMVGDHGSPTWEPMFVYHNTIVTAAQGFRGYYGAQLVQGTKNSKRRVFDNIFIQLDGQPGVVFPTVDDDLQVDGNLHWSLKANPSADIFKKFRSSKQFEDSKRNYAPGFASHDVYADPVLTTVDATHPLDVRLGTTSPAVDAGVAVPKDWPDTMTKLDKGAPDIGAIPAGAAMLSVGPGAAPKP